MRPSLISCTKKSWYPFHTALATKLLILTFAIHSVEAASNSSGPSTEPLLFSFAQMCDTQLVNGETTSRNFDKRPMGFRCWDVAAKGKMVHRFVMLEGMDE